MSSALLILAHAIWLPEFNSPINPYSTIMIMVFLPCYYGLWLVRRHWC